MSAQLITKLKGHSINETTLLKSVCEMCYRHTVHIDTLFLVPCSNKKPYDGCRRSMTGEQGKAVRKWRSGTIK